MHVQGETMKKHRRFAQYWPGVLSPPPPQFLSLIQPVSMLRLFVATVVGSCAVLVLSPLTKSSMAGYAYGALLFTALSWPFVPKILTTARWTEATLGQSVLVLIASTALGDVAQRLLGFNPQQSGLDRMTWHGAARMLWQFPLVLPVENLLLIGAMAFLWQFLRPSSAWQRFGVALLAAALFGLWHVPFWGPWTMWTIGMSVLPWVLYMMATGDIVVPLVAHILMDTMAMVLTFGPSGSLWVRYFWILAALTMIMAGLGRSLYRDWRAG